MLSMVTMVKKPKNQMTSNKQRQRLLHWPDRSLRGHYGWLFGEMMLIWEGNKLG